jgi:preprotein translocase subunit SecF
MSKRYLRRVWKRLKPINTWYFFAAFVIFLVIGIFAARQNNLRSIELRDEVLKVDQQNGDVEAALQKLREHIYSHMNAGLSSDSLQQPIQLKYRYERLLAQQQEKASQTNQKLYAEAQAFCERQGGSLRGDRVPCVQQYVSERSSSAAVTIPDELYKFDFVSPRWSPDLAGFSLLLAGVFLALFLIRFLTERWFRAELKNNL